LPEISVILPVHNGGPYLAAAVQSILSQSFCDLELLLVDDHSTDGVIGTLDLSDPRISVIRNSRRGVVNAFNTGLEAANGLLIARMDADDIALAHRLEVQRGLLNAHPDIGIVGGCIEIFADQDVGQGNTHYQDWLNAVRSPAQIRRQLFIESVIPNPTAMFRREVLERLGGYRDVPWPEDYDLFLRADGAGIRMAKPRGTLLRWREHPDRLTHTDGRYSRENFQRAKAHYLALHRLDGHPFVIWGAGPGGRQMFDLLAAEGHAAGGFIEVHPRRIGGQKRGRPVWDMNRPGDWGRGMILVAVGSRGARVEISAFLEGTGRREGEDFLFVL
jgi:glycosyltransferase involved in cell wall biosynthesis